MPGTHDYDEKKHKERVKKLKAKTSKMRLAVVEKKPYKLTKTDKKRQKEFGDFVVKQEKHNEEVRKEYNKMFGGGTGPIEQSYFTVGGARRNKPVSGASRKKPRNNQ